MPDINNQQKEVARELKKLLQKTPKPKDLNIKISGRSQNLGKSQEQKNSKATKPSGATPENKKWFFEEWDKKRAGAEKTAPGTGKGGAVPGGEEGGEEKKEAQPPATEKTTPEKEGAVPGGEEGKKEAEKGREETAPTQARMEPYEMQQQEQISKGRESQGQYEAGKKQVQTRGEEIEKYGSTMQEKIQKGEEAAKARGLGKEPAEKKEENKKAEKGAGGTAGGQNKPEDEKDTKNQMNFLKRAASKAKTEGVGAAVKELVSGASSMAMQALTAECLKQSWQNLLSTYGATLIYINFHFIMKYIASVRSFCEFGEEWTMQQKIQKQTMAAAGGPGAGENPVEQIANTSLKWAEIIALFLVDILISLLLACIIYIIYIVITSSLPYKIYTALPTPVQSTGQSVIEKVIK